MRINLKEIQWSQVLEIIVICFWIFHVYSFISCLIQLCKFLCDLDV